MLWALLLIASFKYVLLVLRADNAGEGGILALLGLLTQCRPVREPTRDGVLRVGLLLWLAVVGTMLITTGLFLTLAARRGAPRWGIAALALLIGGVELAFTLGVATKLPDGG